ncbi:hypothetical protein ACFL47_05325 [Candidatus Latescibacterota bacterium]
MSKVICFFILTVFCLVLAGTLSQAQEEQRNGPRIEITMSDELILAQNEVRPAHRDSTGNLITKPGDVIQYTLTATNSGTEPALDVEIVDPIPKGTEFITNSAVGMGMTISYSIDGGLSYQPPPVVYNVRRSDGVIEKQPATASMYTHVKWLMTIPIQSGESVTAILKVRVTAGETSE